MQTINRMFIGGEWVTPASTKMMDVISPHTEEVVARVSEASEADVDRAVALAREAFEHGPWPRMKPSERAEVMGKLGIALQSRTGDFAETITREMGSPISFSHMGQVGAAMMVFDYFTRLAGTYAFEEMRDGMFGPTMVRREPVGVSVGIVPWNVPLFISMLKLSPALAAGAPIILKPSPEAPLDSVLLADALLEAGIPKGVVSILPAGREVGEYLVRHPGVDKVSFTGSTAAGRKVAAICGEQLKRVTLELGGKSAAIILDDADLSMTMPGLLPAAMMNNGQACVAQTRILASRKRYDEVVEAITSMLGMLPVGDPSDPTTFCGPLVAERQRERVLGYIAKGKQEGAKVVFGGGRPASQAKGWYVEPTVFTGVDSRMTIAKEEIFGPVVSVIAYDTPEEAVKIANDSEYGLSGSVWTNDPAAGLDIARQVRTGTYTVNGFFMEFSAPFGGFKHSGVGRELGPEGLNAYLEAKSIVLPFGFTPA